MKQKYGSDNMHRFLKHELDQYLRGRAGEIRKERPVVLVQNEPYVYPDTREFVDSLRTQTPPGLQYYITDAFESIVLYDNKAVTATVTQTSDKKYKVILTVQTRKLKSDGSGNETPMALSDYIDIGVFTGKKDEEKPLYLKKEKITQGKPNL